MDTNRELRSMIFCAIHLPPLPAVVKRLDSDDNAVIDDNATESSHSIIGSMMEWSAMANNGKANSTRLLAQTELFNKFKKDLSEMDVDTCTADSLFDFYGKNTRQWLNTYSTVGDMLRFKPLHDIVRGDKTHMNMLGYAKAQHRLFSADDSVTLDTSIAYADLMRKCAQWTKKNFTSSKNESVDLESVCNQSDESDWVAKGDGVELLQRCASVQVE